MFRPDSKTPESCVDDLHIVFQDGQLLSDMRSHTGCLIALDQLRLVGWTERRRQFLGYWEDRPCYVIEIDAVDQPDPHSIRRVISITSLAESMSSCLRSRGVLLSYWIGSAITGIAVGVEARWCWTCKSGLCDVTLAV